MVAQVSDTARYASLNQVEEAIGPGAFMTLWTGPMPDLPDAPDSGIPVAVFGLPPGWSKVAAGTMPPGIWASSRGRAIGTATHFRIYGEDQECHVQGTVSLTGDGGDVTVDMIDLVVNRPVTVTRFDFWREAGSRPDRLARKRARILKARARRMGIPWLGGDSEEGGGGGGSDLFSILDGLGHSANLLCCLDAGAIESWPGSGQQWLDLSPNNGDFYRGADGDAGSDDPTFNGTPGALTDAQYFGGEGTFFTEVAPFGTKDFHKAGQAFTVAAVVYFPVGSGTVYIFSTREATDNLGGVFLFQYEGHIGLGIEDGSSAPEQSGTADTASVPGYHFIAASFDRNGGATGLCLKLDDAAETFDVSFAGTPTTTDGQPARILGALGAENYNSADGNIAALAIWSVAKSAAQLETIRAALKAGRFPSLYEAP